MFSGFYLALVLMLVGLIVRGVALEYRSKVQSARWRSTWDWLIVIGSLLPALLWGVALANILRGVPIDANKNYVGGFFNLLNPYALLAGVTSLVGFTLHGAIFLSLRTRDAMLDRARATANRLWVPAAALLIALAVASAFGTDLLSRPGVLALAAPILAIVAVLVEGWFLKNKRYGWAFVLSGLAIALTVISAFAGLYPRVMVSSLNPQWSLTIYTASSTPYTLRLMTIVAAIFVPIVLLYQGWTYWVFRERVGREQPLKY